MKINHEACPQAPVSNARRTRVSTVALLLVILSTKSCPTLHSRDCKWHADFLSF